ncbi:MAG: hypothetical protein ACRELS_11425 [Candidatus Rokuibacteriota bacterium]
MQMDLWYHLAMREYSDVTERASALLEDADDDAEATAEAEAERPVVAVDFF